MDNSDFMTARVPVLRKPGKNGQGSSDLGRPCDAGLCVWAPRQSVWLAAPAPTEHRRRRIRTDDAGTPAIDPGTGSLAVIHGYQGNTHSYGQAKGAAVRRADGPQERGVVRRSAALRGVGGERMANKPVSAAFPRPARSVTITHHITKPMAMSEARKSALSINGSLQQPQRGEQRSRRRVGGQA